MKSAVDTISKTIVDSGTGQVVIQPVETAHITVVELHGDIDMEVLEPMRDCVLAGVEEGDDVIVDLTDAAMIDCASLRALVYADRIADRRGRNLRLVAPPQIRRVLAAAGLANAFRMIRDRREALAALSVDGAFG